MIFIEIGLFFLIAGYIYDKLTRPYKNDYPLIFLFGKKGSGKTTNLTKIALQHLKKGWHVYSTVEIPGCNIFSADAIGLKTFPENSCILIDEVGMIWDNRDFKNFKPWVRDYFKYQRQYKNKVYMFSQTFDVDLKLRNLTDEMYLLKSFGRVFSIQRRIIKKIDIKECADGTSTLTDTYKFDWIFGGGLKVTFIPRYVAFFKSYDPKKLAYVQSEYLDYNELQKRYLSTRNYIADLFKAAFVNVATSVTALLPHWVRHPQRASHRRAGKEKDDAKKNKN